MASCQKRLGLSFVACMATLGFIMFVTGDDQQLGFADNQNTAMAAAPIPETLFSEQSENKESEESEEEADDDEQAMQAAQVFESRANAAELSLVQTSSAWMWDRSDKARKRMGLSPKYAFKPNPANRARRIKAITARVIKEATARAKSKIGLVSVSVRGAGMSPSNFQHAAGASNKDPFSALMHTASLNAHETKWRNAEALKFVRKAVDTLAMKMIQRTRKVKAPQVPNEASKYETVLSQWMWDSPKTKSRKARQVKHQPLAELKRLARYDKRKTRRHLNRIAQKIVDEAEMEQKAALVQGKSEARQLAVMKIAMVNTYSFLRLAKATVVLKLREFLKGMGKAMIDHIALAKHANKLRKRRQAKAAIIKHDIAKRKAKIAFVKKAIRTSKGRGKQTLQKALAIHQKKLTKLKKAHKAQLRKVAKAADFIHKKRTKKEKLKIKKEKLKTKKLKRAFVRAFKTKLTKALNARAIKAATNGKNPGDSWGAKKKVSRRADCLQEGTAIDCATERIKH